MTDDAPAVVTQEELERDAALVQARVPMIAVTDQTSFDAAIAHRADVKRRIAQVHALFDDVVSEAHSAYRTAFDRRAALLAPYDAADKAYSRSIGAYEATQARARREQAEAQRREQERLEAAELARVREANERQRRAAEDERMAAAAAAADRGDDETAERLMAEPVVVANPEPIRPVIVPPSPLPVVPAAEGVNFVDHYAAEVVDLAALVRAVASGAQPSTLVVANYPALNGLARSLKEGFAVPGVKLVHERLARQRRGTP